MRFLTISVCLLATIPLQAEWIVWANANPGMTATGTFAGSDPAYAGTVTAGITVASDGLNDGVLGLDARLYPGSQLTPSFMANYPVNPDGSFTALANSYNDTQDAYTILLDFSGLANGYLPMGSLVTILDLDILENYRNVTAYDSSGNQIGSAWLAVLSGQAALLDWYAVGGDQTGSVTGPTGSFAAGIYQFLGPAANDDSALAGFRTTQNIRSMSIYFDKSNNASAIGGTGGPGLAIGYDAVPEPGTLSLLVAASLLGCGFRRVRRKSA